MSVTADRLKEAMDLRGYDQPRLAREAGCTQGAISQILTGSTARSRFLPDIARVLRVSLDWLKGESDVQDVDAPALSAHERRWLELLDATRPEKVEAVLRYMRDDREEADAELLEQAAVSQLDLVPIEEIDLAYGLGGTFTDVPVELTIHHFPRLWVETISTAPPALLTIARGRGDSMEPTIKNGDMVIINRSERVIREQDAIWALTQGDIGSIKRIRVRGETVVLLSDNKQVPPEEVHLSEINVVGRVDFVGSRK